MGNANRANGIIRDGQNLFFGNADGSDWNKLAFASLDNSFSVGQTITAPANNSALTASYSVTGTNTPPLLNLSGTWNTTGVARGILLNITDQSSAGTSLLLDLQTAGTSRFRVTKTGQTTVMGGLYVGTQFVADGNQARVPSNGTIGFASGTNAATSADTILARDAANTLALRNGGTAGTPAPNAFRVYNYTDAGLTNFERGFMRWISNTLEIGTEAGGTGAARNLTLTSAATTAISCASGGGVNLQFNGSNRFQIFNTSTICSTIFRISSGGGLRIETASTPASSTATGTTGDIRWDADYIYVATATNTWKRAALSTW
jgi:hypothetical protein